MTHHYPSTYLVTVSRRSHIMHSQPADTRRQADALAAKFASRPGIEVEVTEMRDRAETDLTTRTREAVEQLQKSRFEPKAA